MGCFVVAEFLLTSASRGPSTIAEPLVYSLQRAPIKNNPIGKIHYLSYCNRFFHQIYSFHRGGFRPRTQQISLMCLL